MTYIQRASLALAAGLTLSMVARAQNWPMFRGPGASGIADGPSLRTSWNGETGEGIAWKTALSGFGHGSPIVWEDRIFVVTAVAEDPMTTFKPDATSGRDPQSDQSRQNWKLLALQRDTGAILWQRTVHQGVPRIARHAKASHANETPVTDGEHLAVFLGSEGLFLYDLEGRLLWKKDLGVLDAGYVGRPEYQWGTASSPVIYRNLVIVQCDSRENSFLAAFDLGSGNEVWRQNREELPSWSTPVLVATPERDELVTNSPRYFRGTDPATGKELWRFLDDAEVKVPTPVLGEGLVLLSGGAPRGRQFYAIRPGGKGDISADERARAAFVAWRVDSGGPYTPSPIYYRGHFYVLSDAGVLAVYRAATGERLHRRRVPERGANYSASPLAANGLLYLTSQEGDIHVLRTGATPELIQSNPMGEVLMATPAISHGMIFIRGARHLFAVSAPASG